MDQSIPNIRKRGRPATGGKMIALRLHPPVLAALDRFIADEREPMSRPEAVRLLLADGLIGLGYLKPEKTK